MSDATKIQWTMTAAPQLAGHTVCPLPGCKAELVVVNGTTYHPGYTFNGWWGCQKIAPECEHCYADEWDHRWGGSNWGPEAPRKILSDTNWRKPLKWDKHAAQMGVRLKVFTMSMGDVFEDRPDLIAPRMRLLGLIDDCPNLDWLVLTKRPENVMRLWAGRDWSLPPWPNVWIGASAGTQRRAEEVLPWLLEIPAVVRFLSVEPMLERMDLRAIRPSNGPTYDAPIDGIDWVIAGSESGAKARPANLDWYRALRDQCKGTPAKFFLKQHANNGVKIPLPLLDGERWVQMPEVSP